MTSIVSAPSSSDRDKELDNNNNVSSKAKEEDMWERYEKAKDKSQAMKAKERERLKKKNLDKERFEKERLERKRAHENLLQSQSKRQETSKLTKAPIIDLVSSDDDENENKNMKVNSKKNDSSEKEKKTYRWKTMKDFIDDVNGGDGRSAMSDEEKDIEDPDDWGSSDDEYVDDEPSHPVDGPGSKIEDAIDLTMALPSRQLKF